MKPMMRIAMLALAALVAAGVLVYVVGVVFDSRITLPDGSRYKGELRDGKPHGQGVMTTPDGERQEGEFRDGKLHGQGVITSDSVVAEGEFRNGELHGQAVIMRKGGYREEGEYRDGWLHGQGSITYSDGARVTGEFWEGRLHVQGEADLVDKYGTRCKLYRVEGKFLRGVIDMSPQCDRAASFGRGG